MSASGFLEVGTGDEALLGAAESKLCDALEPWIFEPIEDYTLM